MAIKLRPEVRKFAEQMELKLRENDHKGGWLNEHVLWLAERIEIERQEVLAAMRVPAPDVHEIIRECADVANFAMMVADVVHHYGVQNSVPTPRALDVCPVCVGKGTVANTHGVEQFCIPCDGTGQRQ